MKRTHPRPDGLHANPAFSPVVTVEGAFRLIVVGGQNAVDADGNIVGRGDLARQTDKALENLEVALGAAGAGLQDVLKWTICIATRNGELQDVRAAFGAAMQRIGALEAPPAITVLHVAGLAHPEFLVEIEALAAVAAT